MAVARPLCGAPLVPALLGLLLCAIMLSMTPTAEGAFLIVGNHSSPDNSWTNYEDYTAWMKQNPLYVGDIVVFKYLRYQHVAWKLPDLDAYTNCKYDLAEFVGNETAGQGLGFWITVTSKPQYIGCGVFGHCEYFDQKVIINGSLGPLPANPQKRPNEIPDPRGAQPPNPPARSPPPAVPPPSPPPPVKGILPDIFFSPGASQFQTFFSLITPLLAELEAAAETKPFTLLAPTDDAFVAAAKPIAAGLSYAPDEQAKEFFLQQLIKYHTIPQRVNANQLSGLTNPIATAIPPADGRTLTFDSSLNTFFPTDANLNLGDAIVVAPDLHVQAKRPASKIAVHGIGAVLLPADTSMFVEPGVFQRYVFGKDPASPPIRDGKNLTAIRQYLANTFVPLSGFYKVIGEFSITSELINSTVFRYNLWEYFSSLSPEGSTILVPSDLAWAEPSTQLVLRMQGGMFQEDSTFRTWNINLALFLAVGGFKSDKEWGVTTAFSPLATRLKGVNMYVNSAYGSRFWYPDGNDRTVNASTYYPDLQAPGDIIMSIQSISAVLFPANMSRLLPPSLIPVGRKSPAKPPPPTAKPKSPPPTVKPKSPPPPASAGASLAVSCEKSASWSEGAGTQTLYSCALQNTGSSAASSVRLSCSNLKAVSLWNLDADCAVPAPLVAGQTWNFGFVSSGSQPASVSVKSFAAGGAVSVASKSSVTLHCGTTGPGWTANQKPQWQYGCRVRNTGSQAVKAVTLQCSDFQPSSRWNLNADCSLPVPSIQPGGSWAFGFQAGGAPSLKVSSFKAV